MKEKLISIVVGKPLREKRRITYREKIMKRIMNITGLLLLTITVSACSILHTGPFLLGDIPLPFGRMEKGEVYKDPKNRFQVACPMGNSVVNKGKYGVSFVYMDGISNYGVFAYDSEGLSKFEFTLENMLQGIKNMLKYQKVEIKVAREEYGEYRGYQALDFDFSISRKRNRAGRAYVSRLVKTNNFIYWINYSNAGIFDDEPKLETRDFQEADQFFNGIKFENENI